MKFNMLKVDQMLMSLESFSDISIETGLNLNQIFDYIDIHFRVKHSEFYNNNLKYFIWGQTSSELDSYNKIAYKNYIQRVKSELLHDKVKKKLK